jgi:DNA-binding beta-propeller fold protein YncE
MPRLRSLALAATVIAALAPVSSATAAIVYTSRFGPGGGGGGSLSAPFDIAVDPGGDIFVVDQGLMRIFRYDSNGNFELTIGKPLDPNGEHSGDGQLYYPQSIAIDSSGSFLYVADTSNSRIQVFSTTDGAFIRKFGTFGSGDGELNNPTGIALDTNDNVYVADSRNQRVAKFSSSGTFIKNWGSEGFGDGRFAVPTGVAVDKNTGHVFVTDEYIGRFQEFTSDGGFLNEYGLEETGTGYLLDHPDEISVDSIGGLVYVIEAGDSGQEVSVFDLHKPPDGSLVGEFEGDNTRNTGYGFSPHGIYFNPDNGELLVAALGAEGKKIFRYNTLGTPVIEVDADTNPGHAVARKAIEFDVDHNMMLGSCNVKAHGTMKTPQNDPIFEGESFELRGRRAVIPSKQVLAYSIELSQKELRAINKTRAKVNVTFASPDGCNGGIDQPAPVKLHFTL